MITFAYPYVLLLIVPIALLLWFFSKTRPSTASIYYPFTGKNVERLLTHNPMIYIPTFIQLIVGAGILIALARPQTSSTETKHTSEGIDIMIAFDVSKSMLIEDYGEQSRLELAKEKVKGFIKGRSDDRIGFLMFSGESITLCPPTLDYEVLNQSINAATTNRLKDGTAIGDAIANAVNRLKDSKAKSRIVVLITDGDNNMGSIAPLTAGSLAKGYGIKVYAIAMGKEGEVNFPVTVKYFGQTRKRYQRVNSTINPALLKKISKDSGGRFYRASQEGALEKIFAHIDKLERSKVETKKRIKFEEYFHIPLIFSMILFLFNFALNRTRFRILPS